jgi:hypothetical protein
VPSDTYDFDSVTGTVSNGITLISNSNPYGVEFSSKTKKLYVTENHFDSGGDKIVESVLIQFDLKNTNIPSSKTVIETLYISGLYNYIDEKIYRAGYLASDYGSNRLSVINNSGIRWNKL